MFDQDGKTDFHANDNGHIVGTESFSGRTRRKRKDMFGDKARKWIHVYLELIGR